jgi:hypothetical protein
MRHKNQTPIKNIIGKEIGRAWRVDNSKPSPVKLAASAQQMAGAKVVIPADVKVERAPGWTHDVRFQLPPGEKVIGGFLTEWRNRRAA